MSNKKSNSAVILPPIKQSGEVTHLPANDEPPLPGEKPLAKDGEAPMRVKFVAACGNCKHFMPNKGERPMAVEEFSKTSGQCRRNPPMPVVVGMTQAITGQQRPVVDGYFVPVHGGIWCGRWEPCNEAIHEALAGAQQGNA